MFRNLEHATAAVPKNDPRPKRLSPFTVIRPATPSCTVKYSSSCLLVNTAAAPRVLSRPYEGGDVGQNLNISRPLAIWHDDT